MLELMIAVALLATACGGTKQPPANAPGSTAPTEPTQPAAAMAPDECVAKGGQVKGDIGDGKVACNEGDRDLGRVNQGIEGAVCCAAP